MAEEKDIEDLKKRVEDLERRNFEKGGFQLSRPLDAISKNIIEEISQNIKLARFENAESSLTAAFTLTPVRNYHRLTPTCKIYSDTSTAIADGEYEGQVLILEGSSNTNTVLIRDNANTALDADCTLKLDDLLFLMWDNFNWIELARNTAEVEDVATHYHSSDRDFDENLSVAVVLKNTITESELIAAPGAGNKLRIRQMVISTYEPTTGFWFNISSTISASAKNIFSGFIISEASPIVNSLRGYIDCDENEALVVSQEAAKQSYYTIYYETKSV